MRIAVELPDDFANAPDPARLALEALALAGFQSGALSHYQAAQLLQLDQPSMDRFLYHHGLIAHAPDDADFSEDLKYRQHYRNEGQMRG